MGANSLIEFTLSKRFATRFRICDRLRFADFLGFTISTQFTITFNSSALTGFASFGSTAISNLSPRAPVLLLPIALAARQVS